MAKISRRAVASSSSNSAGSSSSSSVSVLSSTYSFAADQIGSSDKRIHANNIVSDRKSVRSISSVASASRFIDTPLGGGRDSYGGSGSNEAATNSATVDPLRNDDSQFTTATHSNVYAYTTTTG